MINRSAVTVRVRKPFLDWLKSLPDPEDATLDEINHDSTVYLLSEVWSDDAVQETIEHFYDLIFEDQLHAWWTDEADWPQNRDYDMFKEWFEVELHSVVRDLVEALLEDDEDFPDNHHPMDN